LAALPTGAAWVSEPELPRLRGRRRRHRSPGAECPFALRLLEHRSKMVEPPVVAESPQVSAEPPLPSGRGYWNVSRFLAFPGEADRLEAAPDPWPSVGGWEASGRTSRMHATSMGAASFGDAAMAGMSPLMGSVEEDSAG
jgi:hypothetical protein